MVSPKTEYFILLQMRRTEVPSRATYQAQIGHRAPEHLHSPERIKYAT